MTSGFSWQNSVSLCPSSFCTLRANLPVTLGISWLSTFAFHSPIMNRTSYPYPSEGRQTENRNHRKLTKLITWTTALTSSRKLWAMPCSATHDGWVMTESSDKTRPTGEGNGKPLQDSCLENPWTVWKGKKVWHWKMNSPGRYVPNMLLEKSGEITTERMKRWSQSKTTPCWEYDRWWK